MDLGARTGWAGLDLWTGGVEWGGVKLDARRAWEGAGALFLRWERWLEDAAERYDRAGGLRAVAYEQVAGPVGRRATARRIIDGQTAILMAWAERRRIPYLALNAQAVKRWVVGRGGPGTTKDLVRAKLRERWPELLRRLGEAAEAARPGDWSAENAGGRRRTRPRVGPPPWARLTPDEVDAIAVGVTAVLSVLPPGGGSTGV